MTEPKKVLPVPYKPPFPRWVWVILLGIALGVLTSVVTGCVASVNDRNGTIETDLFGFIPLHDERAAPPDLMETPPWEEDGWLILNEDEQVARVRQWNADHGYVPEREPVVPRSGGAAGTVIALAIAGWKAWEAVSTARGRRNSRAMLAPRTPAVTRLAAAGALLLGRDTPDAIRPPKAPKPDAPA